MKPRILIAGNPEIVHVGSHFYRAAQAMELPVETADIRTAYAQGLAPRFFQKLSGGKPLYFRRFNRLLEKTVRQSAPDLVLVTGIAPVDALTLRTIREGKALCVNYLTDDPWSSAQSAPWFTRTLPCYDAVFSPRKANIADLEKLGCVVHYLPFAYDPESHFKAAALDQAEMKRFASDLLFIGGADPDRWNLIRPVIQEKINLALYGGYWERLPGAKPYAKGSASSEIMRKAVAGAKVALCLVRRANRDGHSMRTFELPAMGACLLTEDTQEHRDIFGPDGTATVYFKTSAEMIEKLRRLLGNEPERNRLAAAARRLVLDGNHTYRHRLETILNTINLKKG